MVWSVDRTPLEEIALEASRSPRALRRAARLGVPSAPVEILPEPRELGRGARFATHLCAGALAGATAKTIEAPLDRVKIIFQVSKLPFSFRAAGQQMVAIVRNEGVQGLWKGNGEPNQPWLRKRERASEPPPPLQAP